MRMRSFTVTVLVFIFHSAGGLANDFEAIGKHFRSCVLENYFSSQGKEESHNRCSAPETAWFNVDRSFRECEVEALEELQTSPDLQKVYTSFTNHHLPTFKINALRDLNYSVGQIEKNCYGGGQTSFYWKSQTAPLISQSITNFDFDKLGDCTILKNGLSPEREGNVHSSVHERQLFYQVYYRTAQERYQTLCLNQTPDPTAAEDFEVAENVAP